MSFVLDFVLLKVVGLVGWVVLLVCLVGWLFFGVVVFYVCVVEFVVDCVGTGFSFLWLLFLLWVLVVGLGLGVLWLVFFCLGLVLFVCGCDVIDWFLLGCCFG